jgi:hypothetical protein
MMSLVNLRCFASTKPAEKSLSHRATGIFPLSIAVEAHSMDDGEHLRS